MLQLSQCKLSWQEDSFSKLQKKAAKLLGISVEDFTQFTIVKRSLDARKKPNLFVLYTVRFLCRRESEVLKRNRKNKNLTIAKKEPSLWRQIEEIKNPERVAVVPAFACESGKCWVASYWACAVLGKEIPAFP